MESKQFHIPLSSVSVLARKLKIYHIHSNSHRFNNHEVPAMFFNALLGNRTKPTTANLISNIILEISYHLKWLTRSCVGPKRTVCVLRGERGMGVQRVHTVAYIVPSKTVLPSVVLEFPESRRQLFFCCHFSVSYPTAGP